MLFADILLLLQCCGIVLLVSERSMFNPALWYLALHAYCVTFRLVTLSLGFESGSYSGVQSDVELVKAAIASDISLLAAVAATVWVAHRIDVRGIRPAAPGTRPALNPRIGWTIGLVCLVVGLLAMSRFGAVSSIAHGKGIYSGPVYASDQTLSSIPVILQGLAIQGALLVCFLRRFSLFSLLLFLAVVAASSLVLARAFFLLPIIIVVLVYHAMQRRQWLNREWILAFALLAVVWFSFKPFLKGLQRGEGLTSSIVDAKDYFQNSVDTGSGDIQFLDMQASFMHATDQAGVRFHGATVLPLIYLPIPRFLWPDKPRLNEYVLQISSSSRNFADFGMTPNLSGESYMNFGWFGCAAIPFLYMFGMQMAFVRTKNRGTFSAGNWLYIIFLVSMPQVFRDGLESLVLFPLFNYLPLSGWAFLSMKFRGRRTLRGRSSSVVALHKPRFVGMIPSGYESRRL